MLRQIIILSIIYLLSSVEFSIAANEDYVLSIITMKADRRYIIAQKKSTQGNGMSVCSWIKQQGQYLNFFEATDNSELYLKVYTSLTHNVIVGETGNGGAAAVKDCNMKNIKSWFHVCIITNQTSISFYLNGFSSENYLQKDNISATKSDDLTIKIGGLMDDSVNTSFYQTNVFDRTLTAKDAKDMYNCKFKDGDIISWTDITSKSKDITFGDNAQLIQAPVPCPTPPPYNPIDCSTGEPLQDPNNNAEGENVSPSGDSGTSSQPGESGSSSPSADSGTSSQPGESGSSSPSANSGSSSPSSNSGLSSISRNSGTSSPNAGSSSE